MYGRFYREMYAIFVVLISLGVIDSVSGMIIALTISPHPLFTLSELNTSWLTLLLRHIVSVKSNHLVLINLFAFFY